MLLPNCPTARTDVLRQAMEYFISFSDAPTGSKARPWINSECAQAEKRKHIAYLSWVDARNRKTLDISSKKRTFDQTAKSYKKALRKASLNRIKHIGAKLSARPSGTRGTRDE
ncbi:unnamed protein product [Parnassius mnemosyne]|uniref:Uncharacterized protein n=1 Tax=Parnassius mnemosyne TaxID=213953 RepID=A0AAV1LCA5_9NEOP